MYRALYFGIAVMLLGCSYVPDDEADGGHVVGADATTPDSGGMDAGLTPDAGSCTDCTYTPAAQFTDIQTIDGGTVRGVAGRELPIAVRFPADAVGTLPVVIWSHGGSWKATGHTGNVEWSTALARSGYVVIHFSVVRPTEEQLRRICRDAGLTDPNECDDPSVTGGLSEDELEDFVPPFRTISIVRPGDGQAVVDALPRLATRLRAIGVEIDTGAVASAGWSGGAQVVLQMAGATRTLGDSLPPYADPSPDPVAFVALSPQGPGYSGFFDDGAQTSWDDVRGPVMVLTGAGDVKPANTLTGPVRRQVFELMPPGDKFLFYGVDGQDELQGVSHSSFNLADRTSPNPDLVAFSNALVDTVVAFLDANLRGHQPAIDWLQRGDVQQLTNVDWEMR